jgi:hypothetical protein
MFIDRLATSNFAIFCSERGDNLVKVTVKYGKIPKNDGLPSGKQT